jgi:hypothetical protein
VFPLQAEQRLYRGDVDDPKSKLSKRTVGIPKQTAEVLLARQLRFANTMVGIVPTQVDYSDYRAAGGIKFPFKSVLTWTDGRATIELSEIQPNVPVPDTRFSRPAAAPRRGSAAR